jgi:hypothetical protein
LQLRSSPNNFSSSLTRGEWLRNHIEHENCCGSAEFIKLYGELLSCFLFE